MATDIPNIPGIVKNGVIVPQVDNQLPEGMHVEIVLKPDAISAELQAELAAWQAAGDEAWAMIDRWEDEQQ